MPPKADRTSGRRWVFTLNNVPPADAEATAESMYRAGEIQFLTCQLERAPTTGTLHLQGCMSTRTSSAVRIPDIKRWGSGWELAHLEPARAWEKAVEYANKAETRVAGPWTHGRQGRPGQRNDLARLAEMVRAGKRARDVAEEDPTSYVRYFKGLRALESATRKPYHGPRRCALFWGTTGTGKTRAVYDAFSIDVIYAVADVRTPWFDGYEGEPVVLFDEMGLGCMDLNKVKTLTHRYPAQVPVKGGMSPWMAETVILTSNTHWSHWYPKATSEDFAALQRRCEVFHFPDQRQEAIEWIMRDPRATGNARAPYEIDSDSGSDVSEQRDDPWLDLQRQDEAREVIDLSQ